MIDIPKVPKIPPKEELEYKEKEFMLSVYENFQKSSKIWLWALLGILILAFPAKIFLEKGLAASFISKIKIPQVNLTPYTARDLEVAQEDFIPLESGLFSAYFQVLNPNPDISARRFAYEFHMYDASGREIKKISGESFLSAGLSKFVVIPSIATATLPSSVRTAVSKVKWTKFVPPIDPDLEILQKNSGATLEGGFFTEALVRNPNAYLIKRVNITVLLFDRPNNKIIAVNATTLNDLGSQESRYFRVVWPKQFSQVGDTQVISEVNSFEDNFELPRGEPIPSR